MLSFAAGEQLGTVNPFPGCQIIVRMLSHIAQKGSFLKDFQDLCSTSLFLTPELPPHRRQMTELSSSSAGFRDVAAQQLDKWSMLTSGRKEKVTSRFMLEGFDSSFSHLMCFFISHLDKSASVVAWIWSAVVFTWSFCPQGNLLLQLIPSNTTTTKAVVFHASRYCMWSHFW